MQKPEHKHSHSLGHIASTDIRIEHGHLELVDESDKERRKHRLRRYAAVSAMSLLVLTVLGWALASVYLSKFQVGNTKVSGHSSDAALQAIIQDHAANYRLGVAYPEGGPQKDFSLQEVGLQVDMPATIKSTRHVQRQFASRLQWWRPVKVYLAVRPDEGKLNTFIAEQTTVTVQPAQDATLTIKNGVVEVAGGTEGKHYGLEEPLATVLTATSTLESRPLKMRTLSTRPAISTEMLASSQERIQKILNQNVSIIIDTKTVKPSSVDIADWLELTPKDEGKDIDVTVNSGKVLAFINRITAGSTRPPKAQVEMTLSNGATSVIVAGVNGTDVVNKSEAAAHIAEGILKGEGLDHKLTIRYAPYKTVTAQSAGKWIEVDTTNKRMYAYEGGTLVKTILVSAGAPKTPTVTGRYAVYSKIAQQDMRGRNVDGSSYYQPNVPWVLYFYADYAIHGNYWRPTSYFGSVNSSHGCVGTLVNDGKWIYTWAPIGTPVIVHT